MQRRHQIVSLITVRIGHRHRVCQRMIFEVRIAADAG